MRTLITLTALAVTGALFAQVANYEKDATTKQIMIDKVIPSSNALFDAGAQEKLTDKEWADYRKQAQILIESGTLMAMPGRIATGPTTLKTKLKAGAANPKDWNDAAKMMSDAGKAAVAAIDKKDLDKLSGDVAGMILDSCSGCHDKYMIK